jgi:hypothetical protein
MTETIDTYLAEANNMYRITHKVAALARMMNDTADMVKNTQATMKAVADRQASYIRALDNDTIQSATIQFIPRDASNAENKLSNIGITDPNVVSGFVHAQAMDMAKRLQAQHDKLLQVEELTDEFTMALMNYADKVKSLLS